MTEIDNAGRKVEMLTYNELMQMYLRIFLIRIQV